MSASLIGTSLLWGGTRSRYAGSLARDLRIGWTFPPLIMLDCASAVVRYLANCQAPSGLRAVLITALPDAQPRPIRCLPRNAGSGTTSQSSVSPALRMSGTPQRPHTHMARLPSGKEIGEVVLTTGEGTAARYFA